MKINWKYCLKFMFSGIMALLILSVFCLFYDNAPVVIEQPQGFTNYRYHPGTFWSDMTEGYGFGRINDMGYNQNITGYDPSAPSIVFLGSSHTEAFQMPTKSNYVSLTQDHFEMESPSAPAFQCLNFGTSGHSLKTTLCNLSYAVESFPAMKYAVLEADSIDYTVSELENILAGAYHAPLNKDSASSRLLEKLPFLRIPFIRTLKKQYDRVNRNADAVIAATPPANDYAQYAEALDPVIAEVSALSQAGDFRTIILYHHALTLDNEAGLIRTDDLELIQIFRDTCARHSVIFLDVSDAFINHYNASFDVPYGFMNTAMGEGHLNKTGHRIISEEVYQLISSLEKVN